jgi:putative endonuclease
MTAFVYIIHSYKLSRYYIGSTELSPEERLDLHLAKAYGFRKFTAAASDWVLVFSLECHSISLARKIEKHIKKMKSSKYIDNLIHFPEISINLIERFS